jgi:Domain of unknown function (DUF222)
MDDVRRVRFVGLDESERGLASFVDVLDPKRVLLGDAVDLWQAFDRIERLASNAKTLLAARVEEAGAWKRAGARSAAEHLAQLGGTSTSEARRTLETSKQVAELPAIVDALQGGVLSKAQADAIAGAATVDPAAQRHLLAVAQSRNVTELREECLRTAAAADPDPDATYERIHRRRRGGSFTDGEGAWNFGARGTAERGARFEAALEPIVDQMLPRRAPRVAMKHARRMCSTR